MKKLIILMFIFLLLITCVAFVKRPDFEIIPTMTIPISNKTIVVDAGHGLPDERYLILKL